MSLPSFENRSGRKREREGKRKHTSEDVSQIVMEFQELEYLQKVHAPNNTLLKVIHIHHDLRKMFIALVWNDQQSFTNTIFL